MDGFLSRLLSLELNWPLEMDESFLNVLLNSLPQIQCVINQLHIHIVAEVISVMFVCIKVVLLCEFDETFGILAVQACSGFRSCPFAVLF